MLVGVLSMYHSGKDAFSPDHLRLLQAVTYKMAQSIQNALQFGQAQTNASRDGLTGLPNARSLFIHLDEELARAKRSGRHLSVLVCDLDGFKGANDHFGHLEGNKILKRVAHALTQNCREYDYVARMGGDEFVVVLPECPPDQIAALEYRLSAAVENLGREMCNPFGLGISIGEAHFLQDGADAEQLLAVADRRMYAVKQGKHLPHETAWDSNWRPALVQ
jgi:diguanylate cyclase (GGDEF)-like protein